MQIIFINLLLVFGLNACISHDAVYYERANNASEKSLDGLDKDTK